jgi:hypothetical protein
LAAIVALLVVVSVIGCDLGTIFNNCSNAASLAILGFRNLLSISS